MANGYTKMTDIYSKSIEERYADYGTTEISKVIIDGNVFGGYKVFSFIWEKTFVKEPERSSNGTIGNLNSYATFITPHLKIDFAMMSIDDYRRLYRLILQKNEFTVTCYDIVGNTTTTNKMYFAPDQLPKLYTVARKLASGEKFIEVTGIKDYTVELIGTNNELDLVSITYVGNGSLAGEDTQGEPDVYIGEEIVIGKSSTFPNNPPNGYIFSHWLGSDGLTYENGAVIKITDTMKMGLTLTAQWQTSTQRKLSFNYGLSNVATETNPNTGEIVEINDRLVQQGVSIGTLPTITARPSVTINDTLYYPYINGEWYRSNTKNGTKVNNNDLYWSNYNTTIYCLYDKVAYSLSFETNTIDYILPSVNYGYQDTVILPILARSGYSFDGWYMDATFTKPFASGSGMPPYSLTLYAKWSEI